MNSRNDIHRELEQLSSSLPLDAKMPVFDLPTGYFENFASGVLAIVKGKQVENAADELESLSPLLAGLTRKSPFTLPENYFGNNMELLPVVASDNEELPAWMQQSRTMPFAVPSGYFEGLAPAVLQQLAAKEKPQAKVVFMATRRWMQYAAAAVVAGALVVGSLLYSNGDSNTLSPASQPQAWVEKKLQNVSSQELDDFIETAELAGTEMAQQKSKSRPEVRRMLQDVPVSELDAFLEQLPAGAENLN